MIPTPRAQPDSKNAKGAGITGQSFWVWMLSGMRVAYFVVGRMQEKNKNVFILKTKLFVVDTKTCLLIKFFPEGKA